MINIFNALMLATNPAGTIPYATRQVIMPILMILMVLCSIGVVVIILMQKSAGEDMSAIAGGNSDSFYGKNKSQTKEGKLKKTTIGLSICLLLISVAYFVIAAN